MTKRQMLVVGVDLIIYNKLKDYMDSKGINVCCATSSVEALECFMKQEYCMVIVDFCSQEIGGLDLLRAMRSTKNTPILVLTDHLESEEKIALFQVGGTAYMERPIDVKVCAAQSMALMHLYLDSEYDLKKCFPLTFGTELIINPLYRQVIIDGNSIKLTRTEFDLLFCMAQYPGRVWSRNQLYHQVWDDDFGSTGGNIVRTHIGNLRKKLAATGKSYIQNTRGIGYKFVPPKAED